MNYVVIKGVVENTTELKEYKKGDNVTNYCNFSVAVKRKNSGLNQQFDIIDCVAYRHNAEFVSKYFPADTEIIVEGSLKINTTEDTDGKENKRYIVIAENVHFAANKKKTDEITEDSKEERPDFSQYLDNDSDLPF